MNLEFAHLLPNDFSPNSRVWIYQSSRLFLISEALEIEARIQQFCQDWVSHGSDVKAFGNLFFGQFVVLMTDETNVTVSGCSTDSSVRFIKDLGNAFSVDFFERTNLAFVIKDKIQVLPMAQLSYAIENGYITGDTLYFNNLVQTREEWENQWIIHVKDSWLGKKLKTTV